MNWLLSKVMEGAEEVEVEREGERQRFVGRDGNEIQVEEEDEQQQQLEDTVIAFGTDREYNWNGKHTAHDFFDDEREIVAQDAAGEGEQGLRDVSLDESMEDLNLDSSPHQSQYQWDNATTREASSLEESVEPVKPTSSFFSSPLRSAVGRTFKHISKITEIASRGKSSELNARLLDAIAQGLESIAEEKLLALDNEIVHSKQEIVTNTDPGLSVASEGLDHVNSMLREGLKKQTAQHLELTDREIKRVWKERRRESESSTDADRDFLSSVVGLEPLAEDLSEEFMKLDEEKKRLENLDKSLQDRESMLANKEAELQALEKELSRKAVSVEEKYKESNQYLADALEKVRAAEDEVAHKKQQAESNLLASQLEKDLSEARARADALEASNQQLRDAASKLEQDFRAKDARIVELQARIDSQTPKVQTVERLERENALLREQALTEEYRRVGELSLQSAVEHFKAELASLEDAAKNVNIQANQGGSDLENFCNEILTPPSDAVHHESLRLAVLQQALIGALQQKVKSLLNIKDQLTDQLQLHKRALSPQDFVGQSVDPCIQLVSEHFELLVPKSKTSNEMFSAEEIQDLVCQVENKRNIIAAEEQKDQYYFDQLVEVFQHQVKENPQLDRQENDSGRSNKHLPSSSSSSDPHRFEHVHGFVRQCAQELAVKAQALVTLESKFTELSILALQLGYQLDLAKSKPTHQDSTTPPVSPTVEKGVGETMELSSVAIQTDEDREITTPKYPPPPSPTEAAATQTEDWESNASNTAMHVTQNHEDDVNVVDGKEEKVVPQQVVSSQDEEQEKSRFVEKKLAASVVVKCIERNCRHDCLEIVARVLDFDDEDKKRVGLSQASGSLWDMILPDWSRAQARVQNAGATGQSQNFYELFSDFVQDEIS